MREQTVLAANLLPGDRLLSATLGGAWDAEVLGVKAGPVTVEVVLEGCAAPVPLCTYEICQIRRAEAVGTPSEIAGWSVDAALSEATP